MKRNEILEAIHAYEENRNACIRDKGRYGKMLEVRTRDALLKKGIQSARDVKARRLGKDDTRIQLEGGECLKIEIKTGAGPVDYREGDGMGGYFNPFTKADFIPENIFPKAGLIIWYPWGEIAYNHPDPFRMGWVFTRDEFLSMLETIGKKGLVSSLRVTKNGGQLNLQILTAGMENRLYNVLDGLRTVRELLDELGRG